MKTNFRQKNNAFSRTRVAKRPLVITTFFTVFFIVLFSFRISRGWLFDIARPIWNVRNAIVSMLADDVTILQSKESLIAQNQKLEDALSQHAEDLALASILRQENSDLKQILGRKDSSQSQILATVLDKPLFSPYDTLSIDVGTADGVTASDTVFALGDIPIGFISEVFSHTAKVVLYSAPQQEVNVLIGSDHIEKQAIGQGGGNFEVHMPKESSIQVGDTIVMPSISPNIFATVSAIEFKDADSFQNVRFTMPINIAELQWVEVATSTSH